MPNYKSQDLLTTGTGSVIASATAPSPAHVGQRWFNTATAVTYQYTRDAAGTTFWLDISSGGLGADAARSVDFVGDTDPHLETNGSGLAVGSVYYNREADRYFVCTKETTDGNIWAGRFAGAGGLETTYKSGSDFYRSHTFLGSDTIDVETQVSCDILMVGAGGGGGVGGGGAGGMRVLTNHTVPIGTFSIVVGTCAQYFSTSGTNDGANGGDTTLTQTSGTGWSTLTADGGGGGRGDDDSAVDGGGNRGSDNNAGTAISGASDGSDGDTAGYYGNIGGGGSGAGYTKGGGGGGAGSIGIHLGNTSTQSVAPNGGAGLNNTFRTGSAIGYAGGGGGGGNAGSMGTASHGGGAGTSTATAPRGTDGTGGGGGGTYNNSISILSGKGGSGIIVIRYQLNA